MPHSRVGAACFALVLFCLVRPTASYADVGLGPRISFIKADSKLSDSDRYFGAALRARMSPRTALEFSIDWRSTTDETLHLKTRQYPMQGSLLLYFTKTAFAPYFLGGIGWYALRVQTLDAEDDVIDSATTRPFGWHAGFGAELRLGRHAALAGDYRYTKIRFGDDDLTEASGGGLSVPGLSSIAGTLGLSHDGSMWTAGLLLYF